MEDDIIIRQSRNYVSCISEGMHLLQKHSGEMMKQLWPILLLNAVYAFVSSLFVRGAAQNITPIVMLSVADLFMNSLYLGILAVICRKLDELGYVPDVHFWVLRRDIGKRSLRGLLLVGILALAVFAFGFIPMQWVGLALTIVFLLPFTLMMMNYLFSDMNFLHAGAAIYTQWRQMGNVAAILLVTGILTLIISTIGFLPLLACIHVGNTATVAQILGDQIDLPTYFPIIRSLSFALGTFVMNVALLVTLLPLCFLWGSIVSEK